MNSRTGFLAAASILALACSGSSNNGGAGGAGGGGPVVAMPNPNQMQGSTSAKTLGTDPAPSDQEAVVGWAESVVVSATDAPPREEGTVPPNDSDPFPGQGGSCEAICSGAISHCAIVGASTDLSGCVQGCEEFAITGCVAQMGALLDCVAAEICSGGLPDSELDVSDLEHLINACLSEAEGLYYCAPEMFAAGSSDTQQPGGNEVPGGNPAADNCATLCQGYATACPDILGQAQIDSCTSECRAIPAECLPQWGAATSCSASLVCAGSTDLTLCQSLIDTQNACTGG